MTTCRFSETSTLRRSDIFGITSAVLARPGSKETVIAAGNRALVGADGVVVEVTSCRAFWPLLNGQQLLLTILTR